MNNGLRFATNQKKKRDKISVYTHKKTEHKNKYEEKHSMGEEKRK